MILVDTSVWIDYFRKSNNEIDELVSFYLDEGRIVALSPVFGELLQGVRDRREEAIVLDHWRNLPKVDESSLFIEGGRISSRYKLFAAGVGLIDCYIMAAAKIHKLEILSLDKKLLKAYALIKE